MKMLLYIIIILAVTFLVIAGTNSKPTTSEIILLRDITDFLKVEPQADAILRLYDFSESRWNGGIFRFADLSDVSLNSMREVQIMEANLWLSNELEREKEIKNFGNSITQIVAVPSTVGKNYSSVYLSMARQLNKLNRSDAERKILLIYSDLMENNPTISFYRTETLRLMRSASDSVEARLEKIIPLPSLSGIEVYFIFKPADVIQDETFNVVSEFYRKMLEDKGAHVTISANL